VLPGGVLAGLREAATPVRRSAGREPQGVLRRALHARARPRSAERAAVRGGAAPERRA
jgi:hypothetical protein